MRQWRDQMARGDQPAAAETQPAVADRLSAATGDQLAVRKGSRRRHRITIGAKQMGLRVPVYWRVADGSTCQE